MKTNIPIMVNGKVKASIPVNENDPKETVMRKAMNIKTVNEIVQTGVVATTVYIPKKMFNIVTKDSK